MNLTDIRKAAFIEELARHGVAARAARAASPGCSMRWGGLQTFRDERARDPAFAADWDAAMESARAEVEHELYRRAQEGWEEPVYGGRYNEAVVGTVRKYSDRLLELRAKALLPAYRNASAVHVDQSVRVGVQMNVLGDAVAAVALQMAEAARADPMRLITDEQG